MNIKVIKDSEVQTDITGGECGVTMLEISIDPTLPLRTQRILVIHAVLENYNRSMPHDKVDELCSFIEESLDMLEG